MANKTYKSTKDGIAVVPKNSTQSSALGDIEVLSSNTKLHFHNGTINDPVVTEAAVATISNKSIDGDTNTVTDLPITAIKTNITDASKFMVRDASGVPTSATKAVPNGVVVGTTDTQVLTGKTIDGDDNTVQDLPLTALKTVLASASTFLSRDASGVPISTKAVPTGTVVGTSDTQTLTNKTFDDQLRVKQIATPSAAPSGYNQIYFKTDGLPYYNNSAAQETAFGGSGQGLKNYITTNPGIEQGTTAGFSLGTATLTNNFPSGAPTFGSGASGNLSLSTINAGQLAGNYSLVYTSSSATTAGNFVASDAFAVDLEGQASVMQFKFYYKKNSGSPTLAGNSTNSFGVAIYDVTNAAWIQPAGVFNLVQGSGVGLCSGTFQTSSNGTTYRICVYNANATASSVSMLFDDFFVGPQITAAGAAISDWVDFTPTMVSTWTNSTVTGKYRRVGSDAEIIYKLTTTGTPSGSALSFYRPAGLVIDNTKLSSNGDGMRVGFGSIYRTGIIVSGLQAFYNDNGGNGYFNASYLTSTTTANESAVTPTAPVSIANDPDYIWLTVKVPIVGWSSQTVMSNDTDTRVISGNFYRTAAQSSQSFTSGSYQQVQLGGVFEDTAGAYNTSTYRYTVPVAGSYEFPITLLFSSSGANNVIGVYLYKNGSAAYTAGSYLSTAGAVGCQTTFKDVAKAGDYYELYVNPQTTTFLVSSASTFGGSTWGVRRISGPATIAATETVACRYTTSAGQSITNTSSATIVFGTKEYDTHNAMNASTGVYTIPVSGKYTISSSIMSNNVAWTTASGTRADFGINGTKSTTLLVYALMGSQTNFINCAGSTTLNFNAGDTVGIAFANNLGRTYTLNTTDANNWVCIERIGN